MKQPRLSKVFPLLLTLLVVAIYPTFAQNDKPGGFLFVTFKGEETPLSEQIYFATSRDGRDWTALNGGEPVLVSTLGEKGVRDPYILRSHDGKKFYLIATDLSINLTPGWKRASEAGSRSILVWESADLVNWTQPRLVKVAPDDAGCAWAPEAIYDEETGDYLVFWASTTARDKFAKNRIWAARTRDFVTFGEPSVFIERPSSVIDTTIVRDGPAYYRFSKDEKFQAIAMETAAHLAGPWSDVPGFSLAKFTGCEGPELYQLEPARDGHPATWGLILDCYAMRLGYQPWTTQDLASGKFEPAQDFTFPFKFRHGSVLPITADEFARLQKLEKK